MTVEVRELVNETLKGARKGEAARLAAEAEISPATLSKFRSGNYRGDNEMVADRLGKILASREAAAAIAQGRWKLNWLVIAQGRLRLAKTLRTLEGLQARHPDAAVFRLWFDPAGDEVCVVKAEPEERDGTTQRGE